MTEDATPRDAPVETEGAHAESHRSAPVNAPAGEPPASAGERDNEGRGSSQEGDADDVVAPTKPAYRPSYVFLIVVAAITLAADLGTKWWAKDRLEPQALTDLTAARPLSFRKIEVIKDHLNMIFAKNHGGAWGILGDESEAIRRPFFLVVSLAAIVFIVSLYRKLHPSQIALRWGLPLVLGGALGNLVDRIRYGYVIDFIQVRLTSTFVWPTFNVADIAIVVGVGLMAIDMFSPHRPELKASGAKASAG
ncbi:signal peptidase II [Sorangium sp. So ce327]|jgi:signal peptidase II|uniref:signal peptidase II n=1 Tax=Sorangium sp. So ce327 TaxID=3133301 RepID=UPI003F63FD91